jgi:hypothetical protein
MTTKTVRKYRPRKKKAELVTAEVVKPKINPLKKGTIIHNNVSGEEWELLEDVKDDFSASCICTYVPAISRYKVGQIEEWTIYYKNGNFAFHWTKGKNKNN